MSSCRVTTYGERGGVAAMLSYVIHHPSRGTNDLIHDYLDPNTRHQGVVDDHGNCSGACDGICNGGILTL